MIKNNKSQFAMEFIVLIAFMFLIFLGFFGVVSSRILEAKEEENKQVAEDLANLVFNEIKLANSVADGYSRVFVLPKKVKGNDYSVEIISNNELVIDYLGNEYVIFLPSNIQGDIDRGPNEIRKPNGTIFLRSVTECDDSIDNDGDGSIDEQDRGCHTDLDPTNPNSYDPTDNDETDCGDGECEGLENCYFCSADCGDCPLSECNDGVDNDGDGRCDIAGATCPEGITPGDAGCNGPLDNDETNCGDNVCEGFETCLLCSSDCGTCLPTSLFIRGAVDNVLAFDDTGNAILAGTLREGTTPEPSADDEFIFKHSDGSVVTIVNLVTGNMVIAGTLFETQPTLSPSPTSNNFVVKSSTDDVVAYIDESGDFYLKGTLTENGNP